MKTRKILVTVMVVVFTASGLVWAQQEGRRSRLLSQYEANPGEFKEYEGVEKIAYWQQRKVGEAIVEKDYIVYQFDKKTEELLDVKMHWREDVPVGLPKLGITRGESELLVEGEVKWSKLYIISPESNVFSTIQPTPENPCWVVTSVDKDRGMLKTVIDAVEGEILGYGIAPPHHTAFSLTGHYYGCDTGWFDWYENAQEWFDEMGYSTEAVPWPTQAKIKSHIQSGTTALFYEIAHGDSTKFTNSCTDKTYASEIESWIGEYGKMSFTFIGSCFGMCSTGDNTFSYEFRKGSTEETVTVGYCQMSEPICDTCWDYTVDWQNALFGYMNEEWTVKDAFDQANLDYPACGDNACMRFAGDQNFTVVPVVRRMSVFNSTQGEMYYTIQDAIDEAEYGDEIVVYRGTYEEAIDFKGKGITVRSESPEDLEVVRETIIDADGASKGVDFSSGEDANSILTGFTVTGAGTYGVYSSSSAPVISHCIIRDNGSLGARLTSFSEATVKNCWIYNNVSGGIRLYYASAELINNTIANNDDYGIRCQTQSNTHPKVTNCIVWGNATDIDLIQGDTLEVTYCCVGGGWEGEGNIDEDPLFVDPNDEDYHLEFCSPCINAGNPNGDYDGQTDIDGDSRIVGDNVDMGADELCAVYNVSQGIWYAYIQEAINSANGGDEIEVPQRTYTENIDFLGKAITLRGTDPADWDVVGGTVIDGQVEFTSGEDPNSVLKGLTVRSASSNINIQSSSSPTISNCIIEDSGSHGIYIGSSSSPVINNNIIRGNHYYGIYADSTSSSPTIKNNEIYDNGLHGIRSKSTSAEVTNCTIADNTSWGVYVSMGGLTINNCIIWGNGYDSLGGNEDGSVSYSDIEGSGGSGGGWDPYTFGTDGGGNIDVDPFFADPCESDYHLTLDSPCINSGDPNGTYTGETDIDGQPRIMRNWVDMGADEFLRVHNVEEDKWYVDIQGAISEANDTICDTIVVYPDTYYEAVDFDGKALTLRSVDPNDLDIVKATIIDGGGDSVVNFDPDEGANSMLRGFTITGGGYGVYITSSDPLSVISNCIIRDNDSYGVRCIGFSEATIKNCWIHNNRYGAKLYYASVALINNTIADNTYYGILCKTQSNTHPKMTNCIVWGNGTNMHVSGDTFEVTYSCIEGGYDGEGNISSDPCFVDSSNDDYHLSSYSPCINAGDPSYNPASGETDIDGDERVLGGRVDMGADEATRVHNTTKDEWYWYINEAIDDASNGDEIVAYEDTYYENVDFDGKAITVRSTDPCDPCVVAATIIHANDNTVKFDSGEGSGSVLNGFTITGGSGNGIYCKMSSPTIKNNNIRDNGSYGIYAQTYYSGSKASPTIENNKIYGNSSYGIYVLQSAPGTTASPAILNNEIYDNGSYGVYVYSSGSSYSTCSPTIVNNKIYDNSNSGIYVYSNGYHSCTCSPTIENNMIYGNTTYGIRSHGDSSTTSRLTPTIKNNWIYANHSIGIRTFRGETQVINNTIYGHTSNGIYHISSGSTTVKNCIVWDNGDDLYGCSATYSCIRDIDPGEGNIVGDPNDPLFVNPNEGDYCLGYGSPCIDAANGNVDPPTDIFGQGRIDDPNTPNTGIGDPNYVDMGACEYNPD